MMIHWFEALREYKYAMRVDGDVCVARLPADMLLRSLAADHASGTEMESPLELAESEAFGLWLQQHVATAATVSVHALAI